MKECPLRSNRCRLKDVRATFIQRKVGRFHLENEGKYSQNLRVEIAKFKGNV